MRWGKTLLRPFGSCFDGQLSYKFDILPPHITLRLQLTTPLRLPHSGVDPNENHTSLDLSLDLLLVGSLSSREEAHGPEERCSASVLRSCAWRRPFDELDGPEVSRDCSCW